MDPTRSLLVKPFIDSLLKIARRNLKRDGYLTSILCVKLVNGQAFTVELVDFKSAKTSTHRRVILSAIGQQLRSRLGRIHEAVLLGEGWCVRSQEQGATSIPPSQHPARQEAITIFGRDSSNRRSTAVIQPFTRDTDKRLVWHELLIAEYDRSAINRIRPVGIIDALFEDDQPTTRN